MNNRLAQIVDMQAQMPEDSLAGMAMGNKAAGKGVYRYAENEKVTGEKILGGHAHETIKRCQKLDEVVCPADGSTLDYNGIKKSCEGLQGRTCNQTGAKVAEIDLHSLPAYSIQGIPLGF